MNRTLSHNELCGYLSLLRQELGKKSLFPAKNVIFLGNRAIYHHLAKRPCGQTTVGDILKKIETCIPLAVTEESFSLFLVACDKPQAEHTRSFLESSKADFLLLIHQTAEDEAQWERLTALCESLRQRTQHSKKQNS